MDHPGENGKHWVVYILRCADNTLYTGITNDLSRRLDEHNNSNRSASAYTRSRRPVVVVHREFFHSRAGASRREYQIKQLSRREKERLIAQETGCSPG